MSRKSKFPLTRHPTGQWCKKNRGKLHYFGVDKQEAHQNYLTVASQLHSGRPVIPRIEGGLVPVKDLCNQYMAYQEGRMTAGEISAKHFKDCHEALDLFLAGIGRQSRLDELSPDLLLASASA